MHKIKEITLSNFKFFHGEKTIDIDRKNVLIYGENGSGKSSIYWALYTFFQSVFKNVPDVQNYFNPRHDYNLVNRFANGNPSFIELIFEDVNEDLRTKRISNTTVNTIGDQFIESCSLCSDLIDYKSIFNIYNFTNRERVKLFEYFNKHLLDFINFRVDLIALDGQNHTANSKKWWEYLKKGINPYPNIGGPGYDEFQELINTFNNEFQFYLNAITETANDYLSKHFKEKLKIHFEYEKCVYNELINNSRTRKTKAPEVFLNVTLLNDNLGELERNIFRSHTFLNEARLSSIALAIRMAILKEKFIVNVPKVLILDDLLLSLDMGNRESVLNIILEEYTADYQLFFLTHDRVFFDTALSFIKTYNANLARQSGEIDRNKIDNAYKSSWKVLEMYESFLPSGIPTPIITQYKSHLQKAHFYFTDLENIDYNACGNNLRAALEEFFRNFIPVEFFKDANGDPITANSLILNALIVKCIEYFNHVGWDISILDKLNRYRERALNATSHYNPRSNYYKKELKDTFEILNSLHQYKAHAVIKKDEKVQFSISSNSGQEYVYTVILLDDIRLYKEPLAGSNSFYADNDKRSYAIVGMSHNDKSDIFQPQPICRNKTLNELYEETITALEARAGEQCLREADMSIVFKNISGRSLEELKAY
ncbi:AAA family ATPase [Elizabethkingia anophelis]|uniref:AAA family ATPase n=1 Tax=Elizabethkingia anophelis TaxID=1117645 RepID=UPI0038922A2E